MIFVFVTTNSVLIFENRPSSLGSVPVRLFVFIKKPQVPPLVSSVMLPTCEGIDPVSLFNPRLSTRAAVSAPISEGIGPVNLESRKQD